MHVVVASLPLRALVSAMLRIDATVRVDTPVQFAIYPIPLPLVQPTQSALELLQECRIACGLMQAPQVWQALHLGKQGWQVLKLPAGLGHEFNGK